MRRLTSLQQLSHAEVDNFEFPGLSLQLESDDPELREGFGLVFEDLVRTEASPTSHEYRIKKQPADLYSLEFDGHPVVQGVTRGEAFGYLEWHVTKLCLQGTQCGIALHAAAVAYEGRSLLLAGTSGSGKTTLALSLMLKGAEYLSDEAVFLSPSGGKLTAFPRALALKEGRDHWIDFPERSSVTENSSAWHIAGKTYIFPRRFGLKVANQPVSATAVILLERAAGPLSFVRIAPGEALLPLLRQVFPTEPHDQIMSTVTGLLRAAPCYRLRTSDLSDATEAAWSLLEGR